MALLIAMSLLKQAGLDKMTHSAVWLVNQHRLDRFSSGFRPLQHLQELKFGPLDGQPVGLDPQPLFSKQQSLLEITEELMGPGQA